MSSCSKAIKILACMLVLCSLTSQSSALSPSLFAASDQPRYGGTFILGMPADPDTLNPSISPSTYATQIGSLVYNNLLHYDANFTPRPDLAQSWTVSPDGLTYTFNLVHNAMWHDGYPLTSADVKFTYTQVLAKYLSGMVKPLANLASVDTPDNYTVIFRMSKPYNPLIYVLAIEEEGGGILPEHLYKGTDILTNKYNFAPVGAGPFKFAEWKKAEYVKLVRNDKYFKAGQPYVDQIIFKIIPDPTALTIALQKGEINYLWYSPVPESLFQPLMKDSNLIYRFQPAIRGEVMTYLNFRNPILNKTDVRHALSYAINRTEFVQKIAQGIGKEAAGPIPSGYGPSIFNPNLPVYAYDVSKANQLLDKAGYPRAANGTRFSLELTWQVTFPDVGRAAELMKSQLDRVGVNLMLTPRDRATLVDIVFNRWKFDMFLHSMGTDPIPDVGVARLYITSNIGRNAFNNAGAYSNPAVDALWADATITSDPAKAKQDLYRVQELIVQDAPMLWIWERTPYAIWTKDFAGLSESNTNAASYYLQEVYWLKGSLVSANSAQQTIYDAQSKLTDLAKQGYDVTAANTLLGQAQSAYNSGDYASAQNLAGKALQAAVAPFPWALVAGLAVVVVVAAVAGVFMLRKRRRTEQEDSESGKT